MAPVTIFLCGEPMRGDDGVGPALAARLPASVTDAAAVRVVPGLAPSDLLELPGGTRTLVVDAVAGIAPGQVLVLPLETLSEGSLTRRVLSSHQLPVDAVVGLATVLGRPPHGSFVGVGGDRFDLGTGLSRPVQDAMSTAIVTIQEEVERLMTEPWAMR